ncbi:hypothetical protein GCM10011579_082150 [Streptomyces albiflavescens]|uniref:Uncharacterized protein n=1 Tax=Streptomyces albiflavescens TaxID=1623582 RepID=A0A917YDB3_9ACTN|nr:hypothetical protein GCM10011579_082150 [Streptomyces albiflavescens]
MGVGVDVGMGFSLDSDATASPTGNVLAVAHARRFRRTAVAPRCTRPRHPVHTQGGRPTQARGHGYRDSDPMFVENAFTRAPTP